VFHLSGHRDGEEVSLSKPWKALERRTAKWLGGVRIWRQDFGEIAPDGESETHTWDCKCYERFSVVEMYRRAEEKYRKYTGDRRFILVLFSRKHSRQGDFVLVRMKDYARDQAELAELRANQRTGRIIHGDADS
jgi:hypothetical protein